MKKMLVPVDFSAASTNAVDYATHWAMDNGYDTIILLHSISDGIFDQIVASTEYGSVGSEFLAREHSEARRQLQQLYEDIIRPLAPGINVHQALAEERFLHSMLSVIESEKPEIVVAGTTSEGLFPGGMVSDNVIAIAKISPVRVLVVPASFRYRPVNSALVPVDFRAVDSLSKIAAHQTNNPAWMEKNLLILNVDSKDRDEQQDEQFRQTELALHEYLKHFRHEIFYSKEKNIITGILRFASDNDVELIIALPRNHSFLYNLTHKSISEAIYKSSIRPVLILK